MTPIFPSQILNKLKSVTDRAQNITLIPDKAYIGGQSLYIQAILLSNTECQS